MTDPVTPISDERQVRVKPLEWHGDNGHGAGFKYVIAEPCRTPGWRVWANLTEIGPNGMATSIGAHIVTMKAENRDDAKAAAQADYERRVLSALDLSPAEGEQNNLAAKYFGKSVDAWGALEWFERLASAIADQDRAVVEKDDVRFETCRMVAASSAMRLVRDFAPAVRAALAAPSSPVISDEIMTILKGLRSSLGMAEWGSPRDAEALLQEIIDEWHPKLTAALSQPQVKP